MLLLTFIIITGICSVMKQENLTNIPLKLHLWSSYNAPYESCSTVYKAETICNI